MLFTYCFSTFFPQIVGRACSLQEPNTLLANISKINDQVVPTLVFLNDDRWIKAL